MPLYCPRLRQVRGHPVASSLAFLVSAMLAVAHAQTPPDAGALERESSRALQAPAVTPAPAAAPAARPMVDDSKAARVTVKRIVIDGANLVPVAELDALVADRIGRSLTLAELEASAQRIAEHYRALGWFVRVYLPQQDVTDGTVHIQVLEGRYGQSSVTQTGSRANAGFVQGVVTHRLAPGQPLSAAALERGLLLANDLPGIQADAVLQAGSVQGSSDLALQVRDGPFVTGDVGVNNYGLKVTGRAQAVGGLALNNLSGIGDQFTVRALLASRIHNAQFGYSLPLGQDGLRLAVHAGALDYKLGDIYKPLDADGKAYGAGLKLFYPLLRSSQRNLNLSAGYEHRRYNDDVMNTALRRHRVNAFTLGASGDRRDGAWGGGVTWGGIELTHGRLGIVDVAGDLAADAAGPRARGGYTKLAFNLNRVQSLGSSGWQVQASLSGQAADRNLGSSERFSLGGPHRVRAYPVYEASGDEGLVARFELQRSVAPGWRALGFYDVGHIRINKRTWAGWDGGSGQSNSYTLSGLGLGVSWSGAGSLKGWHASAVVAKPAGRNRGADASGRNSDGSRARAARAWVSVNYLF